MPVIRDTVVLYTQNLGPELDNCVPAGNKQVHSSYFGGLLPWYDGFDRLGMRRDPTRSMFWTEVMDPFTFRDPLPQMTTDIMRARVLPSYWWEAQTFEPTAQPAETAGPRTPLNPPVFGGSPLNRPTLGG